MKESLILEGVFTQVKDDLSATDFRKLYQRLDDEQRRIQVTTIQIKNHKKPRVMFLGALGNFHKDCSEYGLCFEGEIYLYLPHSTIERLSLNGFDDITILEPIQFTYNHVELYFSPHRWLY